MTGPKRFVIECESMDSLPYMALKLALKGLLRRFNLRCVGVTEVEPDRKDAVEMRAARTGESEPRGVRAG